MRKALAVLMLAVSMSAGAIGWTLIRSYYDLALNAYVCVYRSAQGTTLTQVHKGFCPLSPQ